MLPKRHYKDGVELSIIGFGGMALLGLSQNLANRAVGEAVESGVNYFDVAPLYGDGEAEEKLGLALEPYREKVFLACKTLAREAAEAGRQFERSLRRLRTNHFDLYQFHAVNTGDDVDKIMAPAGAAEVVLRARDRGLIRFIGFSSHSVPAALEMLDRFPFDSVLFPVNYVCYAQGNFGPQVVQRAGEKGTACVALKSMALTRWRNAKERIYPNCWYRPIDDRDLAKDALRFALSETVTAAIPPGDLRLFRVAVELAPFLNPLSSRERRELLKAARGIRPIMWNSDQENR